MKTIHSEAMRVLSITLITLASVTSLWAQGQVVTGSEVLMEANRTEIKDISVFELPPLSISPSPNWLPPRVLSDSSDAEMIEVSRPQALIDLPVQPILPPTPDFQIQFNQAGIQPVPEPSSLALLAVGLLIGATVLHRSRTNVRHQSR